MKVFYVTVPVAVPNDLESVDVCNILNRLINIGLEDASDSADDDEFDGASEAQEVLQLQFHEPFLYDSDMSGEDIPPFN
jgi:hypothetical protein